MCQIPNAKSFGFKIRRSIKQIYFPTYIVKYRFQRFAILVLEYFKHGIHEAYGRHVERSMQLVIHPLIQQEKEAIDDNLLSQIYVTLPTNR